MKKFLPGLFFLITIAGYSQSKKYFAITGERYGNTNWIVFSQFDMNNIGEAKTLYIPAETNEQVYDALTATQVSFSDTTRGINTQACSCMNNRMVTAIAYDQINNRLYYTPMLSNQLRYLDLNSPNPKSYVVTIQLLKDFSGLQSESSFITRMCFSADSSGYALTNNNQHLIKFSTNKQAEVTDLGSLIDDSTNGKNSIKNQFTSWGGDLVADADKTLYLFTMQCGVFKINPLTKIATYKGKIKNIPANYAVSGAMVQDDSNVIIGSSIDTLFYYQVNLKTLQATALNENLNHVYNVSDFANANIAFTKKIVVPLPSPSQPGDSNVHVTIYPNPVTNHSFTVELNNFKRGKYKAQITDISGKKIIENVLDVSAQIQKIILSAPVTAGTYLIKILDSKSDGAYTSKLVVVN